MTTIQILTAVTVIATAIVVSCGALAIIYRGFIKIGKIARLFEEHLPVLTTIAEQFKKNGGASLKDQLDRLERLANGAVTEAKAARVEAKNARELAVRVHENVRTLLGQADVSKPAPGLEVPS